MKELLTKYDDWIGARISKEDRKYGSPYTQYLLSLPLFVRSLNPEENVSAKKDDLVLKTEAELFNKMERYDLLSCISGEVVRVILQELASGNTIIVSEGIVKRTDRWTDSSSSGRDGGH